MSDFPGYKPKHYGSKGGHIDKHLKLIDEKFGEIDEQLGDGADGAVIIKKMTATQTSISTTLTKVTELQTAIKPNSFYTFDCFVIFKSAATVTGINLAYTSTAAGGLVCAQIDKPFSTAPATPPYSKIYPVFTSNNNSGGVTTPSVEYANYNFTARISGNIATSSSGGDFGISFASEDGREAVTLQIGSNLILTKVR